MEEPKETDRKIQNTPEKLKEYIHLKMDIQKTFKKMQYINKMCSTLHKVTKVNSDRQRET